MGVREMQVRVEGVSPESSTRSRMPGVRQPGDDAEDVARNAVPCRGCSVAPHEEPTAYAGLGHRVQQQSLLAEVHRPALRICWQARIATQTHAKTCPGCARRRNCLATTYPAVAA